MEKTRDALPYLMIALATPIGIAIGQRLTTERLVLGSIFLGILSSALTFTDWVSRRGASDLFAKFGLSSAILPAFGLAIAFWTSLNLTGWKRALVIIVSALDLVFMLATGNRTNLVMLFVFIPVLWIFFQRRPNRTGLENSGARKLLELALVVCLVGLLFYFVSVLFKLQAFLEFRFVNAIQLFLADAQNDQSFVIRSQYFNLGYDFFLQEPIFGKGFSPFGSIPVLDTPMEGLAKIGILGTSLFIGILVQVYLSIRNSAETVQILRPAFQGWIFVLFALVPFGTVWQDKGLPIALVLAVAMAQSLVGRPRANKYPTLGLTNLSTTS